MKASSESGECASLISRVSVDVLEAVWPDIGSILVLGELRQLFLYARDAPRGHAATQSLMRTVHLRVVGCVRAGHSLTYRNQNWIAARNGDQRSCSVEDSGFEFCLASIFWGPLILCNCGKQRYFKLL